MYEYLNEQRTHVNLTFYSGLGDLLDALWLPRYCGQNRTATPHGFFHCTAFKKSTEVCALVSGIAGEATYTFELVMTRRMHARLVNGPGDLPMSPELSWQKQPVGEEYCTRGLPRLGRSDKSALGRRRCLEPWNKS